MNHKVNVKPENLARVNEALWGVVNEPKGTAFPVRDAALDVAGKTGTAQTTPLSLEQKDEHGKSVPIDPADWYRQQNHAWFAAYAPAKAPEIAVSLLVEHGGAGPTVAAPIAIQIIRDYERITATRAGHPPPAPKPALKTVASKAPGLAPAPALAPAPVSPPESSLP